MTYRPGGFISDNEQRLRVTFQRGARNQICSTQRRTGEDLSTVLQDAVNLYDFFTKECSNGNEFFMRDKRGTRQLVYGTETETRNLSSFLPAFRKTHVTFSGGILSQLRDIQRRTGDASTDILRQAVNLYDFLTKNRSVGAEFLLLHDRTQWRLLDF